VSEKDVPESLKIVIFRIVQEALNNIGNTARPTPCASAWREGYQDRVADRGQWSGLRPGRNELHERLGARSRLGEHEERAALSGGVCAIDSAKGRGTTVRATWPCEDRNPTT